MLPLEDFAHVWQNWRARYNERDIRYAEVCDVVDGKYNVFGEDESDMLEASPNFIQTALDDTAEAASLMPSVRVTPWSVRAQTKASAMERIAMAWMQGWGTELVIPDTVKKLGQYGLATWVMWPDFDQRIPLLEMRDPRQTYPEPGCHAGDRVRRCMFGREVYLTQLPKYHQQLLRQFVLTYAPDKPNERIDAIDHNTKITLLEWFDPDCYMMVALVAKGSHYASAVDFVPCLLEYIPNRLSVVPIVLGARVGNDDFKGQYDQVLDLQRAHVRLAALALDYADQSVYSDIWVRDPIGEVAFGGGGFIQLGPQGAIGRVPPAVSSLNVQQDLASLADGIHLGGRWPRSRPGEIDQNIASAKFLEASAGMMNTAIRTYHLVLGRMFAQALQIAMEMDKKFFPGRKTITGVLRNQQFLEEYTTDDIELRNRVRVEYGLGLGRDPAQSAVLAIQYQQNGYISKEFVQESIEGVHDVARERARIDTEEITAMLKSLMLQGVTTGTLTPRQLLEIARQRSEGRSMLDLIEEFIVAPQEEPAPAAAMSGLGGGPLALGAGLPPSPAPGAGPGGATGVTPPVPGAPQPADLLARLGTNAGPGGRLSNDIRRQ